MSRKEEILATQLLVVLETFKSAPDNYVTVERNRKTVPDSNLTPALVMMDGSTVPGAASGALSRSPRRSTGETGPRVSAVTWQPEIWLVPVLRDHHNDALGAWVNTESNKICKRILDDQQLWTIVGATGDIAYRGKSRDLRAGGTMAGNTRIDMQFTFLVYPEDF